MTSFVPASFVIPTPPTDPRLRLEPLGPEHNERDYAAWTSSIDFIRALPGWAGRDWPTPMTLAENLRDLELHAEGFARREQFCYSVLDPATDEVVGCVYLRPTHPPRDGAVEVRSWVIADRAGLDAPLYHLVRDWLAASWPFGDLDDAPR